MLKKLEVVADTVLYDGNIIGFTAPWIGKDVVELSLDKEVMGMRKEIPAGQRQKVLDDKEEIVKKLNEMGYQINK